MTDMDASPSFVKRTKAGRSVRARQQDEEDASMADEAEASPSTLVTKLKNKHKSRQKSKGRLSFGGDEEVSEGDVFQVKKSGLSRKLKLGSPTTPAVALPSNLDQATITQTNGPIYSKEYLSELKASTPSTPAVRPPATGQDVDMSFDADELAGALVETGDDILNGDTDIPSESSITAAKQKRERLRATGVKDEDEDGFISLTVSKRDEGPIGPHPESRLMREEDELGEGDDEYAEYTSAQERIALGKKSKKKEAAKRKESMREMIEDAEEIDEESLEWEEEQLRRGGTRRIESVDKIPVQQAYKPVPIPPPTPVPAIDASVARLTQALTDLTTSHAKNTTVLSSITDERHALDQKEKEMRSMVDRAETKRGWFAAFRDWVESVATFLDDKFPTLEKLEEEHLSLLKERGEMISKRRLQDDEDDLSICLGSPPDSTRPEEVDELGRVIPQRNSITTRHQRQTDRAARHNRRIVAHDEEGYSTDSTLPSSDASDYQTAVAKLTSKIRDVLADVRSEEFRDPSLGVGKWFGEWRKKHSETYVGAFGGLGMISAWEFWVRLEIAGWDPMEDHRTLDRFKWYGALHDYSRPRVDDMSDDEEPELGPDGDLVSAMVSTAVVPRLCKALQGGVFDPYSAKHLKRLVDLAEQVEVSANSDKFEMMVKSAVVPLRDAVDTSEKLTQRYLQFDNMQFDPQVIPARRRFLSRRLKLLQNLLRWRKYTGEKFGIGDLMTRTVSNCMLPVAETGWEVGGQEIMRKAVDILPKELCPEIISSKVNQ